MLLDKPGTITSMLFGIKSDHSPFDCFLFVNIVDDLGLPCKNRGTKTIFIYKASARILCLSKKLIVNKNLFK